VKIQKILVTCVIGFICLFVTNLTVYADNDGKPKDDPYADSGYAKSYDVEYYDCNFPYTLTYKEIGGIAYDADHTADSDYKNNKAMPDSTAETKVGASVIRENCHNNLPATVLGSSTIAEGNWKGFSKIEHDEDGMCVAVDTNGAKYYIAAFPAGFTYKLNTDALYKQYGINSDLGYKLMGKPQLVDVILTDGTCLHFLTGDSIGSDHCNRIEDPNTWQDGIHYHVTKLNYPDYAFMFHCEGGHMTEVWCSEDGSLSKFLDRYNIGNDEGKNQISVIRMYNASLEGDPPKRLNGNETSTKVANNGSSSSGNSSSFVDESALVGMPDSSVLGNDREDVQLANRDDLSIEESNNLVSIKDNLDIKNSTTALDLARKISVFIGLLLMVYAILLILAITIDMINMWVDVSITRILTFGLIRVQTSPDEPITPKGYISPRKLRIVAIVIFLIGGVIISGGMFRVTSKLMWWITKKFV
jgi:hypothetical protein